MIEYNLIKAQYPEGQCTLEQILQQSELVKRVIEENKNEQR